LVNYYFSLVNFVFAFLSCKFTFIVTVSRSFIPLKRFLLRTNTHFLCIIAITSPHGRVAATVAAVSLNFETHAGHISNPSQTMPFFFRFSFIYLKCTNYVFDCMKFDVFDEVKKKQN